MPEMGARKSEHNRIAKIMREGRAKSSKKTGSTLEPAILVLPDRKL